MSTYFVAPDGYSDETLWAGAGPDDSTCSPVVARHELGYDLLWDVLVGVLTEDADTLERMAEAIHAVDDVGCEPLNAAEPCLTCVAKARAARRELRSGLDVADAILAAGYVKPDHEAVFAADSVRRFLDARAPMEGIDPEVVITAERISLRVSDLRALVRAIRGGAS